MHLLILGGTTEASALARAIAGNAQVHATLSFAGRTRTALAQPVPLRVGGFGGGKGLADYLTAERIDGIIDATHPFAVRITANAITAACAARVPLLALVRPPWYAQEGDSSQIVPDTAAAAAALGPRPRRVLLTLGRQDLGPFVPVMWHHYVLRSIDAPPAELVPPGAEIILARGPFNEHDERTLLSERRIEVVVTKNAGGQATRAKLDAARALGLPVIMVARPLPDCDIVASVQDALAWLDRHVGSPRSA